MELILTFGVIIGLSAVALLLRHSRVLALVPRWRCEGNKLIARTSFKAFLLSLTLLHRTVVVDGDEKVITLSTRLFWIVRWRRTFSFSQVRAVIYRYDDLNPLTCLGASGDTKDWFSVALRLAGEREVHLFNFFGEGEFTHGVLDWLPGWVYWHDRLFDMSGTQEATSREFVTQLRRLLQVRIEN